MRSLRIISVLAAAMIMAVPVNALAASSADTVYPGFNNNDVNAVVTVVIPENADAKVDITFDSPEGLAEPYYSCDIKGGSSASFKLEGRDNTADDYRYYNITVSVSSGEYLGVYSDIINKDPDGAFLIPDPDEHPDSFVEYTYNFTVDNEFNKHNVVATPVEKGKNVTFHFNPGLRGDANLDNKVNGKDATLVLAEYANLSSGDEATFTEKQKSLADINHNGKTDAVDAAHILAYYADLSSGIDAKWYDETAD